MSNDLTPAQKVLAEIAGQALDGVRGHNFNTVNQICMDLGAVSVLTEYSKWRKKHGNCKDKRKFKKLMRLIKQAASK